MSKKGILLIVGIPLFLGGLVSILNKFESNLNFVDWLVSELAPSLPPNLGDIVLVLAICLLIYFMELLPKSIEWLTRKYL